MALLLYAYCTGVRSSRSIERRCVEDVAFRVLAAGLRPDHVTIAWFRARHATALAGVLVDSLRLCAEAGLVRLGVVALDGTKMAANASPERNRTLAALNRQIKDMIADAERLDAAEAQAADGQGTGLPDGMSDPVTRRRRLREAQQRLEAAKAPVGRHGGRAPAGVSGPLRSGQPGSGGQGPAAAAAEAAAAR